MLSFYCDSVIDALFIMEAKLNTKQQTVYLTIGLPASGKTTYAHAMVALGKKIGLSVVRVNNDDIRDELFGPGFDWSPALEKKVRATRMARLDQAIRDGHYVVVDNTHINPKTLNSMKEWLKQTHPKVAVEEVDFRDVPVHVCIDRDRERQARGDRFVGAGVILKMAQEGGLNDDTPPKPIDWLLPFAIVCDLDGTLALFGNKRNPYDASQCDIIDEPNFPVLSTLRVYLDMMSEGNPLRVSKIFFFSGRTDKYEAATKRFLLNKCGFDVDDDPRLSLTMRRDGDFTGDEIIKEQMYRDHIEGKYNVLFIFDDRPKVVRMWHRLGLPVFNVGSGREF